ncbi:hypothetical protein [Actinokineospora iranica]|uniref:Uncharacterized protein n=1 Tax=Actinokineospora iranica TaxID=1271860 RepID=A0A1G6KHC0_9PSEU|nr:hypothetical protein [Actinokineospora iranica]SDC30479.1 hypothetical protein SAMN05216174_101918 [Actinokineospora iranica]
MNVMIQDSRLRRTVAARVAEMPAYEERFWAIVDSAGVDRGEADRLLDVAVEWIGAGRATLCDPYALVLSWMPR